MSEVTAGINIVLNTNQAQQQLLQLQSQITNFHRSLAAADAGSAQMLARGINATKLFDAQIVPVTDSVTRFSKALENNKLALGEYTRLAASQMPGLGRVFRSEFDMMERVAADRVKKIQTQYIALGKTAKGVEQALAITPKGLGRGYATDLAIAAQKQILFNKVIDDGATKLLNWGKNTQWAGRQLMVGFTLPLAAMGAAASKAFMEIDKASTAFKRVYGDLSTTTEEMNNNLDAVKALGKEYTKYGIAVKDTVDISARVAATGATNEKLMAATKETLRFATLSQMDYNQALDTTISLQTAFATSNEELGTKVDYLNAVENQTILTMEDMSVAIPRVATVVKGLGGDVEDLAVMMTAMREGGVSAENAANGLKSGLASMINPTKAAQTALKKLGIDLNGIVQANKGDLLGTVRAFGTELNKLGSFERQQALEKVFGKYQYARMSALFTNITNQSSQAARAMDLAGASAKDLADIANKELGKVSESTTVKFQAAMENLKVTIAPLGEAFLKALTPAINFVSKVADAFNNLPSGIKNAMAIATVAIAGIGPVLLMGIGLMGNLVANVVKGIQWWRRLGARLKGTSSEFQFLTEAELAANSASNILEGSSERLTQSLLLQRGAVSALTGEYERFAAAAGIANGAMGGMGAMRGASRAGGPRLKMATGGIVPGTGNGDTIPALLTPGESVITKKATQKYGPILQQMNDGTLPGFAFGGLSIGKTLSSLLTTSSGIPGIKGGRESILQTIIDISQSRGIRPKGGRSLDPTKPPTLAREGKTFAATPIIRGHHIPGISAANGDKYLPGLMFWQGKGVNSQLVHGGVTGEQLLADYRLMEKSGIYPPSLMISALREMGLNESSVDLAYAELKRQLRTKRGHVFKDDDFLDFAGRVLNDKLDKDVFSALFNIGTVRSGGKSVGAATWDQFKNNSFSTGVLSIGQALKSWQTSSRAVRENPELLAALNPGFRELKRGRTFFRSTTLGLGRGSEFSPQDHALIFDALRTGDYGKIIGREFELGSPLSYSQSMQGTMGALASNQDVNRIKFLRSQHALARRKHKDDLAMIARLEANIASGSGPIDLYKRQLAERQTNVATYAESQKALGREIKALAPRGYQGVHIAQDLYGGTGQHVLDVNLQNRLAGQEGTFMGKNVAREAEYIVPPSRIQITGVKINPETGLPILETSTVNAHHPGKRRPISDRELLAPERARMRKYHYATRSEIDGYLGDKKIKTENLISLLSNKEFNVADLATLEKNFGYRWENNDRGINGRLKKAIEEKRAILARQTPGFAFGGVGIGAAQSERLAQLDLIHGAGTAGIKNFRQQDSSGHFISGIYTLQGGSQRGHEAYQYAINNALEHGGANAKASAYTFKYANKKNPGMGPRVFDWESKLNAGQIANIEKLAAQHGLEIPSLRAGMSVKDAFNAVNLAVVPQGMFGGMAGEGLSKITNIFEKGLNLNKFDMIKNYTKMGDSASQAILRGKNWVPQEIADTSKIKGWPQQVEESGFFLNSGGVNLGMPQRFANGGKVPGVGNRDTIPALLTPGESVITKEASAKYAPILHAMNKGTLPGFAKGRTRAPGNIQRQGKLLDVWDTIEEERRILAKGGLTTHGAASHIVPQSNYGSLGWDPRGIQRDLQAINHYIDQSQSFAKKTLSNQKRIDTIVKNTGLTERQVRAQLQNFSEGIHATTRESGKVLHQMASMQGDKVSKTIARVMEARLGGTYYETLSERAYKRGGKPVTPWTVEEAKAVAGEKGMPSTKESVIQRNLARQTIKEENKALTRKAATLAKQDAINKANNRSWLREQDRKEFINRESEKSLKLQGKNIAQQIAQEKQRLVALGVDKKRATDIARRNVALDRTAITENALARKQAIASGMVPRSQSAEIRQATINEQERIAAKQASKERFAQGYRRFSGTAMGIGMTASMLPMFAADKQTGKFMGMDAGTASMGLMAASFAPGLLGGIGKGVKALGKTSIMGSLLGGFGGAGTAGIGAAGIAATGGVVAGLGALAITAWALKKGMDNTLEAGTKYADALTISTKEQKDIASLFGRTTLQERRLQKERSKTLSLTTKEQQMGAQFVQTDQGKAMVEQAKFLQSKGADIASVIGSQLSRMIISGAVNKKQAKAIATGLADALGKPDMAIPISLKVDNIVGPNGVSLTKDPTKIIESLKASFQKTESGLQASANRSTKDSGFLGLSGEFDALVESQVAYANTYLENTKQIITAIDDQITREDLLIQKLKEKEKIAKTTKEKEKITEEIKQSQAQKKALEDQKKREEEYRRQQSMNILLGSGEQGRAEKFTAMLSNIESQTGTSGLDEAINAVANANTKMATGKQGQIIYYGGLNQEEKDKLKASMIVDIKLGKIDPNALSALDAMSQPNKSKIIPIALNLYQKGNIQGFNEISKVSGLSPEVQDSFVKLIDAGNKLGITNEQFATLAETLTGLNNAASQIAFINDVMKSGANGIEDFAKSADKLKGLNIDVASIFAKDGMSGILETANAIGTLSESLKKFDKDIKKISKEKTQQGKISKTIEVATKVASAEGIEIKDPKILKNNIANIAKEAGLTEKKFLNLPPDIIVQSILVDLKAQGLADAGHAKVVAGNAMIKSAGGDIAQVKAGSEMVTAGRGMIDAANQLEQGQIAQVQAAAAQQQGGNDGNGSNGGGGSKTNYVKDMMKGFLDQARMFANANMTMKQLTNGKNNFIKELLLTGKANKGIVGQLRKLGLSENIIASLMDQGPEALTQAFKKYSKGGKAMVQKANIAEFKGTISGLVKGAEERLRLQQGRNKAIGMLRGMGTSKDIIDTALQDDKFTNILNTQYPSIKKRNEAIRAYIELLKKEKTAQEEYNALLDPTQALLDNFNNRQSEINADIERKTSELTQQSNIDYRSTYGESKSQTQMTIADNEQKIKGFQDQINAKQRLISIDQHEIDLLEHKKKLEQDNIDSLQGQIDLKQRSIDAYQRENTLRNQQADVINHSLDIMSQQEDKIKKSYDDRIKALDTVASINDHIINQQKSQLNIAQALSQGDVYAAAAAQQDMQAQNVQYASDQFRQSLQTGMENQIAGLRTEGGLTRIQAEQQLNGIKEQNYQNDLQITALENQIYDLQVAMIPYKDKIAGYDKSIATYNEDIYTNNQLIYGIQTQSIDPLQQANDRLQGQLDKSQALLDQNIATYRLRYESELDMLDYGIKSLESSQAQETAAKGVAQQWQNVAKQISQVNELLDNAKQRYKDISLEKLTTPEQLAAAKETLTNAQKAYDASMTRIKTEVDAMNKAATKKYKGGIIGYANGSVGGVGGRDSVNAMLTPGEYVVRKASVQKYGTAMFDKINMGSFAMPRYNTGSVATAPVSGGGNKTNIVAPVYNTYSVNVPVTQPGASADEIANKVMTKIRNVDNSSIRRINGY